MKDNSKLEIGGVYVDSSSNRFTFINYINTTVFLDNDKNKKFFDSKPTFHYKMISLKEIPFFYKIYSFSDLSNIIVKNNNLTQFSFKESIDDLKKISQIDVSKEIIPEVRKTALKIVKSSILEYTGHENNLESFLRISASDLNEKIINLSKYINLYSSSENPIEIFDPKKLLIFS